MFRFNKRVLIFTGIFVTAFLSVFGKSGMAKANPLDPAGVLTSADLSKNAFSHPPTGLQKDIKNHFFVGNAFFKQSWVVAPSSTEGRDGLGPTYNAVACASCHTLDGRGPAYLKTNKLGVSLLFRLQTYNGFDWQEHPNYGGQINPFAVPTAKPEGVITHSFEDQIESYPDGSVVVLKKPVFTFKEFNFGDLDQKTFVSPRIAAQLVGLGLIEAIAPQSIVEQEDVIDVDGDNISGKVHYVLDISTGKNKIGRFGWKAEQPTVRQQVAAAFLGDIGITSEFFPNENCPVVQIECTHSATGGAPELDSKIGDRVTTYSENLAVPKSRHLDLQDFEAGFKIFESVDCLKCHSASYRIDIHDLKEVQIYPFSDFLLHDMGEVLSDFPATTANIDLTVPVASPELAREWRTPPLWGIGLLPTVNGHQQLLHDGRANGVEEAILWHGGEAESSKQKFKYLKKTDRDTLIRFINNI